MKCRWILLIMVIEISTGLRGSETGEGISVIDSGKAGRVLKVEHGRATLAFSPQEEALGTMVNRGMMAFTRKTSLEEAWGALVSSNDVIGLKVYSAPGGQAGTKPAVVEAVIKSMVLGGIPPGRIIIWDKRMTDLRLAGFQKLGRQHGVEVAASQDEGYDSEVYYETPLLGNLVFGDLEFGKKGEAVGRRSYVSKLLTRRITKNITITPLLNHNMLGVTGALYNATLSAVDNVLRFEQDPARLPMAIPEIFALPEVGDRFVLHIVDALICQHEGEEQALLHYSSVLNQIWISRDPVALDVLGFKEVQLNRPTRLVPEGLCNELFRNAELLELGISEEKRMRIERLRLP